MFGPSSGKIDLPSVPATLARIISITNSQDSTPEEVAAVVMLDQSLATKCLRIANSAFYGRRAKAETIKEAVLTLGFSSVRNLAASASVVDALFPKQMFPGFDWQEMWIHSVTCAVGAEVIYPLMSGRPPGDESAFVAGLLHDVGKLVLARALPQRFRQVVEHCVAYNMSMVQVERNILSIDHAQIGGELAQQWDFPDKLRAAVAYHHDPQAAYDFEDIARAVRAANLLAKRLSGSYLIGVNSDVAIKEVAVAAGITLDDTEYVVNQVRARLKHCSEILSWSSSMPAGRCRAA